MTTVAVLYGLQKGVAEQLSADPPETGPDVSR